MSPSRRMRWLSLAVAAGLALALGTGCDSTEIPANGNANQSTNQQNNQNQNQNQNQHNHGTDNNFESGHDDEYFEAHGPDPDEVLLDVGAMQGSWRASFADGDKPLAYFDIFHDEGETTADGDFMQGIAISEMQDGTTGSIEAVTIDGDDVTIEWNPTDAMDEMYILMLSRVDETTFSGEFSALMYPDTHAAELRLMEVD